GLPQRGMKIGRPRVSVRRVAQSLTEAFTTGYGIRFSKECPTAGRNDVGALAAQQNRPPH
ncbi:MAG: hypothetical protein ACK4P3_09830, partial [Fimbriimonadaceae bacterium]